MAQLILWMTEAHMTGSTLDQLESVVWGESTFDSYLVKTCHRLRTKPVDEFTVEDFRIMIGHESASAARSRYFNC